MKIFNALALGINRTFTAWRGILIMWFCSLLFVSLLAIPLKATLNSALGSSMITERLSEGINIDIIPDLGPVFFSLLSSFSSGLLLIILIGFLLNVFLTGGLFAFLQKSPANFTASEFFRSASSGFGSFFIIMLITGIMILFLALIIMILPATIVSTLESSGEKTVYILLLICGVVSTFITIILLCVTDYARAWKVLHMQNSGFRALGFGFRQTFRVFLQSFLLMLILVIIQVLFIMVVFSIISVWRPETGRGTFWLFIASQSLFFIKIVIRTLRYAAITALMELETEPADFTGEKSGEVYNYDNYPGMMHGDNA